MKTSIIVSSLAALCLMLTFAETPTRFSTDNNKGVSRNAFTYLLANDISIASANNYSATGKKNSSVKTMESVADDFGYLKFDVADYSETNINWDGEIVSPAATLDNTFEYLKFDVGAYDDNYRDSPIEKAELPGDDFKYLKFDANIFIDANEMNSVGISELPLNEFNYLKFDVNNYINENETNSGEITELPEDEFSYLKFDVDNYIDVNEMNSIVITELPVNEFSHLNFDVSKFSVSDTRLENITDLPLNE